MRVLGAGTLFGQRGFGCFSMRFRIDFCPMCTNLTVLRYSPGELPLLLRAPAIGSWRYGLASGWFRYRVVFSGPKDRAKQQNLCALALLVLPTASPVARCLIAFSLD